MYPPYDYQAPLVSNVGKSEGTYVIIGGTIYQFKETGGERVTFYKRRLFWERLKAIVFRIFNLKSKR